MVCWKLGEDQRRALEALRSSSTDARVVRNAEVILLTAQGRSKERIALELGLSLGTVNNVRRWYRQRGLSGLKPAPRPGRRSRATPQYRALLRQVVFTPPQRLGYRARVWSASRLAQHLERETGIRLGEDQMRRILRQEGLPARRHRTARDRERVAGAAAWAGTAAGRAGHRRGADERGDVGRPRGAGWARRRRLSTKGVHAMSKQAPALVRGFAWLVFVDPDQDGGPGGEPPWTSAFGPPLSWWIEGCEPGIRNPIWGDTFLVVTDVPEHPRVNRGWAAEPADLGEGFRTEDGSARLARLLDVRRTPWGIVQQCEFEVLGLETASGDLPEPLELLAPGPGHQPGARRGPGHG